MRCDERGDDVGMRTMKDFALLSGFWAGALPSSACTVTRDLVVFGILNSRVNLQFVLARRVASLLLLAHRYCGWEYFLAMIDGCFLFILCNENSKNDQETC